MVKGIEHVAIFSHDTKKLKEWYERVLGFKTVFSNGKGTYFLKATESGMIELVQTEKLTDVFDDEISGIRHIALTVDSFDQMVEKIRSEKVTIIAEPDSQASSVRTFFSGILMEMCSISLSGLSLIDQSWAENEKTYDLMKNRLNAGKVLICAGVSGCDLSDTDILCMAGIDLLWIEMEHACIDLSSVCQHTLVAQSHNVPVIVRMPWNDPVRVKPLLDMGVDGLVFPLIKTVADAELAVASTKYPPRGIRGYAPGRVKHYGLISDQDYLETANDSVFVIVQIEQKEAVDNIEGICQVPGLDAVLIGCSDLSASYGHLQQIDTPDIMKAIDCVAAVAKENHIVLATAIAPTEKYIRLFLDRGIQIFYGGGIGDFIISGARKVLTDIRSYAETLGC